MFQKNFLILIFFLICLQKLLKKYFRDIQSSVSELEEDIESQVSLTDDKSIKTKKVKNKDEK